MSLLLALLRKKLAEFDAQGGDTKLMLTREQIAEMVRVFLPATSNEARLTDQIDAHINKAVDLGFLRPAKNSEQVYEVRRILKAFVDGQWLADFDTRLAVEYAASWRVAGGGAGVTGFRLARLELYNWGTFGGRVWSLGLERRRTRCSPATSAPGSPPSWTR